MGIIQKQAIQNAIYSYLGAALGFISVGIIFPNILDTNQNGLLKILVSLSTLFAQFSNLGSNGLITRLFPYFQNSTKQNHGFLFYPLALSALGFLLFTCFYYLFYDFLREQNIEKSLLFVEYMFYLIPLTFFTLFFTVLDAYSRSLSLSVAGSFLKELAQRIFIFVAIVLYYYDIIDFSKFVLFYIISLSLPTLLLAYFLFKKNHIKIIPDFDFLNKNMIIQMYKVSLFSILTSVSFMVINTIDTIMINDYLGLKATGIYGITFLFGSIIMIPARSILRISSSIISNSWKTNDLNTISQVYEKSCINQLIIGSLLFTGIWVNIDNILKFLPTEYAEGKFVIFFIGLGNLFDMATGVNGEILSTSKYYRYDSVFMIFLIFLTIGTNLIFIPQYGISGAAFASALSLFVFNFLRSYFVYKKFNMLPFNKQTFKVLSIILITFIINMIIPKADFFVFDIIVRSSIVATVFITAVYISKSSEDINQKIDLIKNIIFKS